MKSFHLIFIIDSYPPAIGGISTVFGQICTRLAERGYTVTVYTRSTDQTLSIEYPLPSLTIHRGPKSTRARRRRCRRSSKHITKTTSKQHNADTTTLIHTTSFLGALPAWCISRWYHLPIVITIHEIYGPLRYQMYSRPRALLHHRYERLICTLPYSQVITPSHYTHHLITQSYHKPSITIPNSINHDYWTHHYSGSDKKTIRHRHNIPEDQFVIIRYGHTGPSKGIDLIIDIIPKLSKQYPQINRILIPGPSQRFHQIYQHLQSMQKQYPITLLTDLPQDTLRDLVSISDLALMPSLSEGYGLAAAEICATNTPLICSHVGALPEVAHGDVTWIAPTSSQLYDAIVSRLAGHHHPPSHHEQTHLTRDQHIDILEEIYKKQFSH